MARLASVTGLGSYFSSSPYRTEICLQSVAAALGAGGPAGVGQQQQGEQPQHLGIAGQPGRQAAGQVDAGHAQVGPEQAVA